MNKHHQHHSFRDTSDHTQNALEAIAEKECVLVNKKSKRGKPMPPQIMCPTMRQITMHQIQTHAINPETVPSH